MHTISSEELLEFLFQESTGEKNEQIIKALEEDWNLKEEYNHLLETVEELSDVEYSPSQQSVENILNYARISSIGTNA